MLTKSNLENYDLAAVLEWYVQNGIDGAWLEEPQDRMKPSLVVAPVVTIVPSTPEMAAPAQPKQSAVPPPQPIMPVPTASGAELKEAIDRAKTAQNLAELKQAIQDYPYLTIKSTATQIVFGDGNPQSHLMIIGDAPASDDDRSGIAFAGEVGDLLNKMMNAIGRTRDNADPAQSFYVTNILNWRPPGNRTPTQFEIDLSMPFLKRHIELVSPRAILLTGNVATKALLGTGESITKIRGKWRDYECTSGKTIKVMPSFHPSYLLKSPTQKKASWDDLQILRDFLAE
jgi:uracil-DNA glycosylase family 4